MSEETKVRTPQPRPMGGRGPMGGGIGIGEKAKDFKGTTKKLLAYLKPYWIGTIVVIVFAIASTIFAIMSPKILGNMTTQVFNDYIDMKAYDSIV